MMKCSTLFFLFSAALHEPVVTAFHPSPKHSTTIDRFNNLFRIRNNDVTALSSTVTDDDSVEDATIVDVDYQTEQWNTAMKRSNVIGIAQELRNKYGYLLNPLVVPRNKQTEFVDAIMELEDDFINSSTSMTTREGVISMLSGDWDLICTIAVLPNMGQKQQQEIPSLFDNEFIQNLFPSSLPIASFTNKFVTIMQRVRCMDDESDKIDRVDHVIEVKPPNQVSDVLDSYGETPSWLSNLNINPLEVKESKVILVHNAEVVNAVDETSFSMSNDDKKVKLRLKLQSVVNNIAGTGGNLDPNGSDILSVNVPQLDILSQNKELNDALGGSFVTTYIDDEYRISRSDLLSLNLGQNDPPKKPQQIRIFQKRRSTTTPMAVEYEEEEEDDIADVDDIAIEAPSDVED